MNADFVPEAQREGSQTCNVRDTKRHPNQPR